MELFVKPFALTKWFHLVVPSQGFNMGPPNGTTNLKVEKPPAGKLRKLRKFPSTTHMVLKCCEGSLSKFKEV